jgi:serine/threonine protein kinase, bacterial
MSEGEAPSRAGTQFGPYRLLRLLGRGGMGEVYAAEDTVRERMVALKLIPSGFSQDPVFRKRMQREARTAGRLQEPHVVPIHDFGEIDGQLFVDMRLIEGTDLGSVLSAFGPMAPPRAVAIIRQVASALDAAHDAGVMHRDVKPANILLTTDDFPYLVDFGIASAATDEKLTQMGSTIGTWIYMAPERFTDREVSRRADIYSLACVLFECLTGSPPYRGKGPGLMTAHLTEPIPRPSEMRPGMPAALDGVVARGMAKDPASRYPTAGDLALAAHEALSERDQDRASDILRRSQVATLPQPPRVTDRLPRRRESTPPPSRTPPPTRTPPPQAAPSAGPAPPAAPYVGSAPAPGPPPRATPPPAASAPGAQPWPNQPHPSGWGPSQTAAPQQLWSQPQATGPKPRRKRWLLVGAGALLAVVLVVVLAVWLWPSPNPAPNAVKLQVLDDGVSIGAASAPTTIDVFNEPICPKCGEFIRSYQTDLETKINDKQISVHYHLLNFLDDSSASHDYSTRAIAASLCVASENDPKLYTDFYAGLFGSVFQPEENGSTDPSDSKLADLATTFGANSSVKGCIGSGENLEPAKTKATNAYDTLQRLMSDPSTPSVFNGKKHIDTSNSSWLDRLS